MKIIQVYQTNPFEEGQGGGVRYVKNLLNGIKYDCSDILFIGVGAKYTKRDNINLLPITKDVTGYIKFLLLLMLKLPFMDLSKYDIVHVHRLYFAIPFILLKPKLKIVCSLHGRTFSVFESNYSTLKLKLIKPLFMLIEKFSIKHIDYLAPVSQDVINTFELKYKGFSNKKNIEIASPMIDLVDYSVLDSNESKKFFNLDSSVLYLGFLGRLSDVKDVEFLIELFHKNKCYFIKNNIKLAIYGDGELRSKLEKKAVEKGLNNLVLFIGEVSPTDVDRVMSTLSILLISSKHESGPIVMKEAMLCGIPVIANDIGEVGGYVVNCKNGYIVNKDYDAYLDAIKSLINNPISKEDVVKNSAEQLKKCSIKYVTDKYKKLYIRILND
jgi:L-malate glycosyltransferase